MEVDVEIEDLLNVMIRVIIYLSKKKKRKIAKITKKNIQQTIHEKSHLLPWIDSSTKFFFMDI